MQLTKENYHSLDANRQFMSRGQYFDFIDCEARAVAVLNSEWIKEISEALLVGQYVHTFNDGTRSEFISNHPEMFKRDGGLKSQFLIADKMIETLQADPFITYVLEGSKEVILTADMFGTKWKVMLDVYNQERRRIVDIKTTRSIAEHVWNPIYQAKLNFVEQYNYVAQGVIYAEVERLANGRPPEDWFDFYLVAVSKQDYPDKEVIDMRSPERYRDELGQIEENMPRVLAVKNGLEKPKRCGVCSYCRSTKKLTKAKHWTEL